MADNHLEEEFNPAPENEVVHDDQERDENEDGEVYALHFDHLPLAENGLNDPECNEELDEQDNLSYMESINKRGGRAR